MRRLGVIFCALGITGAVKGLSGCELDLPEVSPEQFACFDNRMLDDQTWPCPESHWCLEASCQPRFGCFRGPEDGCEGRADPRLADGTDVTRCAASFADGIAAVSCQSGVYTTTSTRPRDFDTCDCAVDSDQPDAERLLCVASAGPPIEDAYSLYILPNGGRPSFVSAGLPDEVAEWRTCARPCSSEASCPAEHTCRPAAVWTGSESASARQTIAVCFPNRLRISTSSTSNNSVDSPDPRICRAKSECPGSNTCQYRVTPVPDHPARPAGPAWGTSNALVARCVDQGGLTGAGLGCTAGQDASCESGLCLGGRCARLCDPDAIVEGCTCTTLWATRTFEDLEVRDLVHVCSGR